jgi:hypothetical protein
MALTTFTAAQVLTAAQMNAVQGNDYNQTVSTKTASYTLVAADKGTRVVMNVASANTVTVNTSLFTAGDTLVIQNIGAGVSTVTAGTATVSSAGPLAIPQYGSGTLYFTSAGVAIFFPSAGPAASSGLTFITSGTFTTVSEATVTACFTATYANYLIMINGSLFDGDTYLLFGTGGTVSTATNTFSAIQGYNGGTFGTTDNSSAVKGFAARSFEQGTITLNVFSPQLGAITRYTTQYAGKNSTSRNMGTGGGTVDNTTSFTDFSIRSDGHPTGSITFAYKVYGYQNS